MGYIRTEDGGEFIHIAVLLSQYISSGKALPFPWLKTITFSTEILRPLVEKCSDESLYQLLSELYKWRFIPFTIGRPLLTPHVHRILKIVRSTDDPVILGGSIIALSTSKFIHIAGIDLLIKMLRSDQTKSDFSNQIFRSRHAYESPDAKDTELLCKLALEILKSPRDYALRIVLAAAEYLAENTTINLPPMLREEEALGLQVHS